MKNLVYILIIGMLVVFLAACKKDDPYAEFRIEGITPANYPKVDASTSAAPLQTLIACKLMGWRYSWERAFDGTYVIYPNWEDIPAGFDYNERIKTSKTHDAIINLINKDVDFILSLRKMSSDEQQHADEMGVDLIETPIALDAFIFIVNRQNQVNSLTTAQIQDIYMGKLTSWSDLGGSNQQIQPYLRNANSGSQELMETLVMKGLTMPNWPSDQILGGMDLVFRTVMQNVNSICFSLYYYHEQMMKENIAKAIAVDGVPPDKKTIRERQYPFLTDVYAVIRSDLDQSSMAYRLYELLTSDKAKPVITESGYLPN